MEDREEEKKEGKRFCAHLMSLTTALRPGMNHDSKSDNHLKALKFNRPQFLGCVHRAACQTVTSKSTASDDLTPAAQLFPLHS